MRYKHPKLAKNLNLRDFNENQPNRRKNKRKRKEKPLYNFML